MCALSRSFVSNYPHGLEEPPGSSRPWNFPGKNTGVGCATLGDLPDPGIEPVLPVSPALTGRLFTTVLSERPRRHSGKHA